MNRRSEPKLWVMEGRWSARVTDIRTVEPVVRALSEAGQAKAIQDQLEALGSGAAQRVPDRLPGAAWLPSDRVRRTEGR